MLPEKQRKPKSSGGRVRRKLATVLAADVASYSSMVAESEEATIRALKAARQVFDLRIEDNGGRIANTAGDSVVAVFDSPVSAVRCAIEVQTMLASKGYSKRSGKGDRREPNVRFRIGIHLGDVLLDGQDVLGDAVNLAARLESIATPGAICISSIIREQIGNRFDDYPMSSLGEQNLKNIPQPVTVYELLSSRGTSIRKNDEATRRMRFALVLGVALFIVTGAVGLGIMSAKSFISATQTGEKMQQRIEQTVRENIPEIPVPGEISENTRR